MGLGNVDDVGLPVRGQNRHLMLFSHIDQYSNLALMILQFPTRPTQCPDLNNRPSKNGDQRGRAATASSRHTNRIMKKQMAEETVVGRDHVTVSAGSRGRLMRPYRL